VVIVFSAALGIYYLVVDPDTRLARNPIGAPRCPTT
jgi:hypothetical protein